MKDLAKIVKTYKSDTYDLLSILYINNWLINEDFLYAVFIEPKDNPEYRYILPIN